MALNLQWQTASQFAARFRARYRTATEMQAAKMAYWMIERINAGDFTDAQVRNAFDLTTQQYTNMKARMTTLHDNWAAVIAARGE